MKYRDSIAQANQKMALATQQLGRWQLPANPINFAVAYEYIDGSNQALIQVIKQQLTGKGKLDNFFLDDCYRQYVLGQSQFRDEIVDDLDEILLNVEQTCQQSSRVIDGFVEQIDNNVKGILSNDRQEIKQAALQLRKASLAYKHQQLTMRKQLLASKKHSKRLQSELAEVRKDIYIDPLTGLYNRKAMTQQVEKWLKQDPDKQIAAIAINLDEFEHFSKKFGQLLSDLVLAKVAGKVGSYVDNSGLPVRTGGDEILILLPDISSAVAGEIAEKIRQGIAKLRFVAAKSGIRFPPITLSMGISEFNASQGFGQLLQRSHAALKKAQSQGRNRVVFV